MRRRALLTGALVGAGLMVGCDPECSRTISPRVGSLDAAAWTESKSEWLSAADAPVYDGAVGWSTRVAPGTSWFAGALVNEQEVRSVRWMTAGLGVYEVYVNGRPVGNDFLKPGFTHCRKTKYAFTYDVTELVKSGGSETNVFAAEVSAAWWRDKIVSPVNGGGGFVGRKSAFRGVLEFTFADGTKRLCGTNAREWRAGVAGPVLLASIFEGEEYDARQCFDPLDVGKLREPEVNLEFKGEILPTAGAEVCLRRDLALDPVEAYVWSQTAGATNEAFGTVVKARTYAAGETMRIAAGEHLVLDFGQNAAAVPYFRFQAKRGTVLTARPAEMLNDGNGSRARGNDGPEGAVYRANLRSGHENGRLARYTFAGEGLESYHPRFTYFGYRYLSIEATDTVEIESVRSVPVSSVRKEMELGTVETGVPALNRFIRNVYWGQLSNYLSVPTDCPQRDERIGWTADTQVFAEAGSFVADTRSFMRKWMRDLRDSQHESGGFPSVAPFAHGGNESMRFGWADAGVIVPYTVWKQFGDTQIVEENFAAMEKYLSHVEETRYDFEAIKGECAHGQYADWLSFEDYEPCNGSAYEQGADGKRHVRPAAVSYWNYLGACYWLMDAQMLAEMSAAIGEESSAWRWRASATRARKYLRENFVDPQDGMLVPVLRHLQGAALFALRCGILADTRAIEATKAAYRKNLADHGGCSATGFLGTSVLMDTLTANGMTDVAYDLLLNHKFPSWLYSVDQGATTVWERWNSYTKDQGFGPVGMNSFNHYAYGAVLAWIFKTAAGIAADPAKPGFANIIMAPKPDRRLGFVKASYQSAAGLVTSAWRYEGEKWIWEFTIPDGATASVTLPGSNETRQYTSGTYLIQQ